LNKTDSTGIGKRAILLSIETKVREFPGKVLLACYLAEKGFRVVFTNNRSSIEVAKYLAWLYIDRNAFFNRHKFFSKLKKVNVKIACIDEEGIVWANPDIYRRRLNPESIKQADLFFTWGHTQTELVKETGGKVRILETGNPRMDLLRPELRNMYQEKADAIKETYGDFLLIASNFAWNNHYFVDNTKESPTEAYLNLLRRQGQIINLDDESFHTENLVYKAKVFKKLQQLVRYLSRNFPDLKIIVRPHPSENHEEWKTSMKDLINVKVVFQGELESWIMAARVVIHNSCTSGLIAALLNRKAISYMPYEDIRFEHELPNSVSIKAYTEDAVAEFVRSSPIYQDIPAFLNEHITSLTGPMASERIAEAIMDSYDPKPIDAFFTIYLKFKYLIFKILRKDKIYSKTVGSEQDKIEPKKNSKDYFRQKFDFISAEEVREYVTLYSKLLNRFDGVYVQETDGNVEVVLRSHTSG